MDSDLKIATVNTKPMAIEEIGSDEERQTRLRRKKQTLVMDDTLEFLLTRGSESSDARGSRDPAAHPVETSIAQRTAPHELTYTSFRNWCGYCVGAGAADDPNHRQPHKEPEFPIIMADCCLVPDAPGKEFFTILDMLDIALGMMQQSVWRKRCRLHTWSRRWSNT